MTQGLTANTSLWARLHSLLKQKLPLLCLVPNCFLRCCVMTWVQPLSMHDFFSLISFQYTAFYSYLFVHFSRFQPNHIFPFTILTRTVSVSPCILVSFPTFLFFSHHNSFFLDSSFLPLLSALISPSLSSGVVLPTKRIVKAELVDYPQDEGPIKQESNQSKICSVQ